MKEFSLPASVRRAPAGLWSVCLCWAVALAWDASGLDMGVMRALADAQGFAWRHQWWLERVLHDGARHLATAAYLGLWLMVWRPLGPWRRLARVQRLEVALGATWGLLAVNAIKRHSLTSCPWDLQAFGGTAQYVSHWLWGVADGGPGHCFPGGHASAALTLLGASLPWLTSADPQRRARGRRWLWGVVVFGAVLGLTQTLRGAHHPSHTLWTGVICWTLAVLNHHACRGLVRVWAKRQSSPSCAPSTQADGVDAPSAVAGACRHSQAQ